MRAKIGESGDQQVAINVAGDDFCAVAGCHAASHSVAWSKSHAKSVLRFSKTGNKAPAGRNLGECL
jgi:hypothetical protein